MAIITGIRMDRSQNQAAESSTAAANRTEKTEVSFTNLMKQTVAAGAENLQKYSSDSKSGELKQVQGTKTEASYGSKVEIQTKEDAKWSAVSDEVKEEIQSFEKEVNRILEEELDVSEEEITAAMDTLGLTYADLMDPQNLTALVGEISGTQEPAELLLNTQLKDILLQVSDLVEHISSEVGLQKEEIAFLMMEMEAATPEEQSDSFAQEIQKQLEQQGMEPTEEVKVTDAVEQEPVAAEAQKSKTIVSAETDTVKSQQNPVVMEAAGDSQKTDIKNAENTEQKVADAGMSEEELVKTLDLDQEQSGHTGSEHQDDQLQKDTQFEQNLNGSVNNISQQSGTIQGTDFQRTLSQAQYLSQIQTEDMIQQISQQARTGITNGTTSLEMQLNPENLGKILLQVTEKEGVIHAQLVTQNEAVKTALETQMADLRQNLNQQGIKVDAVEVTVSSHAFEENLEQNQNNEQTDTSSQKQGGSNTRRNMNLDELDQTADILTEEEALAAQIMKDHGNKVDMTA